MKHFVILSIVALLVIQTCFGHREESYSQHEGHPRPYDHPPDRQFGMDLGWVYNREEGYWHHPESRWRWHPSHGWREYEVRREYR